LVFPYSTPTSSSSSSSLAILLSHAFPHHQPASAVEKFESRIASNHIARPNFLNRKLTCLLLNHQSIMSSDWVMPVKAPGNDNAWAGGNSANGFETNGHNGFDSGGFGDGNAGGADLGGGGGGDDRACFNCGETG
jgi:hypothetical protein